MTVWLIDLPLRRFSRSRASARLGGTFLIVNALILRSSLAVNECIHLMQKSYSIRCSQYAPAGFEPATIGLEVRRSVH